MSGESPRVENFVMRHGEISTVRPNQTADDGVVIGMDITAEQTSGEQFACKPLAQQGVCEVVD